MREECDIQSHDDVTVVQSYTNAKAALLGMHQWRPQGTEMFAIIR